MTTPTSADRPHTALELVVEAIARIRSTDPTDTAGSLLAAWHGFDTAEAAGRFLAQNNVDNAALASNAGPVIAAVGVCLQKAPALPYTEHVVETVDGLVPAELPQPADDDRVIVYHDPDRPVDNSAPGLVRQAIQALTLELNTLLPQAAEHARDPADRTACEQGTRLAYELACCWAGRLRSFLNDARDLGAPPRPRRTPREGVRHKRTKKRRDRDAAD